MTDPADVCDTADESTPQGQCPVLADLSILDLAFIALSLVLIHFARRWGPLYALLVWPGTLLHELSHWLVALVLGGRPSSLSVVPSRTERGWRLGAVGVRNVRWFNALPIGAAPLLLAPLAAIAFVQATRVDAQNFVADAVLTELIAYVRELRG